ncbi:hypothetical protein GCM10020254_68570 [Streptomyces goshikiensis]
MGQPTHQTDPRGATPMTAATPRRALLAVTLAAAATATVPGGRSSAAGAARSARTGGAATPATVDNRFWYAHAHWLAGTHHGTAAAEGDRPALRIDTPVGRTEYQDPHTGKKTTWEYATWTSPVHRPAVPATEAIASWNARTPAGTWIQIELRPTYTDGATGPWYVMGRWAAGDGDIRRTSVDGQTDGKSTVWTDTLAVDHPQSGLRIRDWQLRSDPPPQARRRRRTAGLAGRRHGLRRPGPVHRPRLRPPPPAGRTN